MVLYVFFYNPFRGCPCIGNNSLASLSGAVAGLFILSSAFSGSMLVTGIAVSCDIPCFALVEAA